MSSRDGHHGDPTIRDGRAMVTPGGWSAQTLGDAKLAQLLVDVGELGAQRSILVCREHAARYALSARCAPARRHTRLCRLLLLHRSPKYISVARGSIAARRRIDGLSIRNARNQPRGSTTIRRL